MFFEQEVNQYFSGQFESVNFGDYLYILAGVWTLVKLLFFAIPTLELSHVFDLERATNRGILVPKYKRWVQNWIILLILVPVVDCFIFFYIVINVIGRVAGLYPMTVVKCQIYGIGAGILNLMILSNLFSMILFSSGYLVANQHMSFLLLNGAIVMAWAILSAYHLYYIYLLNRELHLKVKSPQLFSDHDKGNIPFTADHL